MIGDVNVVGGILVAAICLVVVLGFYGMVRKGELPLSYLILGVPGMLIMAVVRAIRAPKSKEDSRDSSRGSSGDSWPSG
jgi:hypothetical protein